MGYMDEYRKSHQHPLNKAFHSVGIPLIALSLPALFFSWRCALGLFVAGWVLQFAGHAIEGKPPAFLRDPRYVFVSVYWWVRKLFGLERDGDGDAS